MKPFFHFLSLVFGFGTIAAFGAMFIPISWYVLNAFGVQFFTMTVEFEFLMLMIAVIMTPLLGSFYIFCSIIARSK
jgi:hypothetical protein